MMKTRLWNKVQQLPETRKQRLMPLYVQIPFVIRSSFPEFFEAHDWYLINVIDPTHQEFVNTAFLALIQNLRAKIGDNQNAANLELITATENLTNTYYNRSADFVDKIKHMLQQEMTEVISELEYFGSANKITNLDIEDNIELLKFRVQQCAFETQKLHYAKEQLSIKFQDLAKRHNYLQQFPANGQPKEMKHKHQADTNAFESSLRSHAADIKNSVKHIRQTIIALKAVQNYVVKQHLGSWIHHQKLEALGYPAMCNLPTIQSWCESIAKMLWKIKLQLETVITSCLHNTLKDEVVVIRNGLISQIINLVSETFIVDKQPSQVVKTSTQFEVTVRLLVGSVLNVNMNSPQVTAYIINESQRRMLSQGLNLVKKDSCGQIINNTAKMECIEFNEFKTVLASFKSMRLTKPKRADKKAMESVMDEKFAIVFQCEFKICGEIPVNVSCFSLPIAVTVHGNQEPKAWATILWDNAFSAPNREAFEVPEEVTWRQLTEALNIKFKKDLGKELNNDSLNYLATKLFGNNSLKNINDMPVSWTMFTKEQLNTSHVISDWIFCALKLSKDNLKYLWDENLILGFISKSDAEEKLLNKPKGTFLLRFSDSALGAISVAAVGENNEVFMVAPWNLKDFNARSLADRIMDIAEITHLYPDIPKEVAFAKHCNVNEESNAPKITNCSNYIQAILTTQLHPSTRLDFNSNVTSPSQHSDYSEDYNKQFDIDMDELLENYLLKNGFDFTSSGEPEFEATENCAFFTD